MTRPAPQHPDAMPERHTERPCDHPNCPRKAVVYRCMGGYCAEHEMALWGVTGWHQSTRDHWST